MLACRSHTRQFGSSWREPVIMLDASFGSELKTFKLVKVSQYCANQFNESMWKLFYFLDYLFSVVAGGGISAPANEKRLLYFVVVYFWCSLATRFCQNLEKPFQQAHWIICRFTSSVWMVSLDKFPSSGR